MRVLQANLYLKFPSLYGKQILKLLRAEYEKDQELGFLAGSKCRQRGGMVNHPVKFRERSKNFLGTGAAKRS